MRFELLANWQNPEWIDVLTQIRLCTFGLGKEMTREQANAFETIAVIFERPPSPTVNGIPREHFPTRYVWKQVWRFLQRHPMFMAPTIQGILDNFESMRRTEAPSL
jgi:hypothetical protein